MYKNNEGKVLVKFLHNERAMLLPIACDTAPYYDWKSVKGNKTQRLCKHLRIMVW